MPSNESVLVGRYTALKTRRDYLKETIEQKKAQLEELENKHSTLIKTRELFLRVAQLTQSVFKQSVENPQTMAIQSVFNRPFQFELQFDQARNNATCTPVVREGDVIFYPKDDMGGGIIDLVSITLRFILWSLSHPRTRKIFILDEPLKFIGKGALLQRAGAMLQELSRRMGFQLIIVTHEDELAEIADKAYHIEHDGRKSNITQTFPIPSVRTLRRRRKK
ncbi:MAG: hypothetical protein DRJ03_00980 [Chloroflexi bacterium]|nr:MAG: hypothetical protein DRJ03_00980 [Chloroflexota bacterium]